MGHDMDVRKNNETVPEETLRQLHNNQLAISHRNGILSAVGQVVLSLGLFFYIPTASELPTTKIWISALVSMQLVGIALYLTRHRKGKAIRYIRRWLLHRGGISYLSSILWGFGSVTLFIASDASLYQGVLILSLVSVASSNVLLSVSALHRGILSILFTMLPVTIICLAQNNAAYLAISLILFVYSMLLIALLRHRHSELLQTTLTEVDRAKLLHERTAYHSYMNQAQKIAKLANWELDLVSGELTFSDEAYQIFSIPRGKKITKNSLLNVIHMEDRIPYLRSLLTSITQGKSMTRAFRLVRPDGSLHTIKESGELSFSEEGEPLKMFGVMFDETDRVAAELKTSSIYQELNRILNHMQDTYYRTDPVGRLTQVSHSISTLLGYRPESCIGWHLNKLYTSRRGGDQFIEDLHASGGVLKNYEIHMLHKNGGRVWASINGQFIRSNAGKTTGIEGTIRDITEFKQAKKALYQEKEQALVTLESIGDGVITTDKQGRILYMNPTAEKLVGAKGESVRGEDYQNVLELVDEASGRALQNLVTHCLGHAQGQPSSSEGMLVKKDGSSFHLKITTAPMRDELHSLVGAVLVLHDISEVMGMAKQLSYQARHDQLTGLYNRNVFEQRAREIIKSALHEDEQHVLLYMDLDQFKVVNDTCGHHAGDELLKQISALMHERLRESDILARLGGDEFGILLEHCPVAMAEEIASKLLNTVREFRFAWEDKAFEIGISIGMVPINKQSGDISHVLSAADAACYVAKDSGRNRIHIYQPDDDAVIRRHGEMQWVHRLSSAFDQNRFILYAQPISHIDGDRLVSHYEILVRMQDESGQVIPPGAFIPAAERYNLMPVMDRWVIRKTLEMIRDAQGELAFPPVECAINLSGQSLCDDEMLTYVVDLFDETGIPCESISFEVTETAAVANLTRAKRFISVLRGMGCSFSLDDFGAGLSSFGYLKSLPVDYLKIDGAFVRDMVIDRVDNAMVRSINEIGHLMGLKTIGEYAEDELVLEALLKAGVDYAQGDAISPPRAFSEVLEMETRALLGE